MLLNRLRDGQTDAWQRLTEVYGPEVYRWARESRLQESDAADIVQETFAAVAVRIHSFRKDRPSDSFRGWLWTITRSKVCDHFRRMRGKAGAVGGTAAHERLQEAPAVEEPEQSVQIGTAAVVHRVMALVRDEFEDRTWQAFWEATMTSQTAAEIGERLGMAKRAVRQAKYRVLQRIRAEVDGIV